MPQTAPPVQQGSGPPSYTGFLEAKPFCTAHPRARHTDTRTTLRATCVGEDRIDARATRRSESGLVMAIHAHCMGPSACQTIVY